MQSKPLLAAVNELGNPNNNASAKLIELWFQLRRSLPAPHGGLPTNVTAGSHPAVTPDPDSKPPRSRIGMLRCNYTSHRHDNLIKEEEQAEGMCMHMPAQ